MPTTLLLFLVVAYFLLLLFVAWYTSRNSNNESFFIGNKKSNWILVAFGMVGTSLSGVTFVSVPGTVGTQGFEYFQVAIGNFIGYFIVAFILLPLYYKLNLTSIYNYLQQRFGNTAHKTGSSFFIISRILGATARLYLVINVLQIFILDNLHVPFWFSTFIILFMILLYTFKGGVKTIVFTDTLQTTCMLTGLIICIIYIMNNLGISFSGTLQSLSNRNLLRVFNGSGHNANFWLKQIAGGIFITIGMTGLDQEMMQKNISIHKLKNSQKNMMSFSVIFLLVNFLFLLLGGLLLLFAQSKNIQVKGDDLFPAIALNYLPSFVSIIFIIALISALFPSADGALTALTSSFCIDILELSKKKIFDEKKKRDLRITVHILFAFIFFICVMIFKWVNDKSIINVILKVAGYTYGPLLGLFAFGIFTKRVLSQNVSIVLVCIASPVICYMLTYYASRWFNGYEIGIELLIWNGLLSFLGLLIISKRNVLI